MHKRPQNRIAESRYALPLTSVYALAVWFAGGLTEMQLYIQLASLAIAAFLMVLLNNHNNLIRIYSRMVSCSFIALNVMAAFLFTHAECYHIQLCFITALLLILRTYQDKKAPGTVFYAFICIGIASTMFIQILFFVPLLWILMASNMMAISARMLFASLLGLAVPYWFLAGYWVYTGTPEMLAEHFIKIAEFGPLFCNSLDTHRTVTLAYISLLAVTGIIHYLRNSYMDKIRTRMIYEMIITVTIFTILFIILQPQHTDQLIGILIICTSVLIAHYIALTHTWITNMSFYIIIAATLLITAYNLWKPSLTF